MLQKQFLNQECAEMKWNKYTLKARRRIRRRVKKEKNEFELLTIQNATRKKLGLPIFDSYQAFLDREENPDEPDVNDEILFEAANVLSDFIVHSYKPIVSMNKAS